LPPVSLPTCEGEGREGGREGGRRRKQQGKGEFHNLQSHRYYGCQIPQACCIRSL
jgi:hypothetical protein